MDSESAGLRASPERNGRRLFQALGSGCGVEAASHSSQAPSGEGFGMRP